MWWREGGEGHQLAWWPGREDIVGTVGTQESFRNSLATGLSGRRPGRSDLGRSDIDQGYILAQPFAISVPLSWCHHWHHWQPW